MPGPSRSRTRATSRWSGWPTCSSTPSRRSWPRACRPAAPRPGAGAPPTCTREMTRGRTRPPGPANAGVVLLVVAVLALAAGCEGPRARHGRATATVPPSTAQMGTAGGLAAVRGFASVRGFRPTPVPVRLKIPAIGVDTGLQRLGRSHDGTVEVPSGRHKWEEAGWYAGGARPGDLGSAVLLGHVDSTAGPAVFYRL